MRNLTRLDSVTLARIKASAIAKLIQLGLVRIDELPALALAHVDAVLDRVFEHCAVIQIRIADDKFIQIHPQGAVH